MKAQSPLLLLTPLLLLLLLLSSRLDYHLLTSVWLEHSTLILCSTLLVFLATLYATTRPYPVYLLDLSCYKPQCHHKATHQTVMTQFGCGGIAGDSERFQRRIIEKSGIGQETYLPYSLLSQPLDTCLFTAREEAMEVIFGAVDELVAKTGVKLEEIGVVVVNCSTYNPTPSLSGMIVRKYGMREDVVGYNLSGMGCSSGLIAMDLVKRLLQVHPDTYALLVSTENITLNGYFGHNRSMLVTNSLFRMGGAAILLSNRPADRRRAKYQLLHTIRTHKGAEDQAYSCVNQQEDEEGRSGIALSKDLMTVAGEALKANITTLGPLVLPISEQLQFLKTLILRKLFKLKVKPYIPDFKLAFEHFCIHAGGRAVLDELERNLQLTSWHMEPSRMTLYRFGNTSSSSLWYELAYCEAKGRIKRGNRVWQVAFGSGFKCNSAVWRALRTVEPTSEKNVNPWMDEIERFPVVVPELQKTEV